MQTVRQKRRTEVDQNHQKLKSSHFSTVKIGWAPILELERLNAPGHEIRGSNLQSSAKVNEAAFPRKHRKRSSVSQYSACLLLVFSYRKGNGDCEASRLEDKVLVEVFFPLRGGGGVETPVGAFLCIVQRRA